MFEEGVGGEVGDLVDEALVVVCYFEEFFLFYGGLGGCLFYLFLKLFS